MLQRAAETVSGDDECNDPAVLLACALGSTGCPAKCSDEAQKAKEDGKNPYEGVQAGDLNVAVSTSSNVTSIPNSGIVKVAELALKASENIQLQSVVVTREWLSQNSNLKVWIEKDGRRITSSSSFFGDSKANLTFNNNGYVVNGNETLDLVISLSGVTAGSELQFKVSDLVSSAKSSSISPDTTSLFRTADYKATSLSFVSSTANSPRSYNMANDTTFSFGEFKLQNDSEASMEKDVMIKSITFKVEGSIENIGNFKLLRDSKEVSSKYSVDGKSITFAVNNQLDSGKSATYKVTAEPNNIESASGDTYELIIKKAEDVVAEEIGSNATAYRVSVKNGTTWTAVSLGQTKISGGNVTLSKDSKLASTVSADWGYTDVVVAKGTVKVNQPVKFESAEILGSWNVSSTTLRRATLVIDGKSYQAEITANKLTIWSEIYFSKGSHDLELQVSLVNTKPIGWTDGDKITFKAIDKDTFKNGNYTNGDETQFKSSSIAGNIRVSDISVAKKKVSVKKTGPAEDIKLSQGNTDERVLLAGEITNGEDKVLEVNKFVVSTITGESATGVKYWDVYAVLTADGTSSSTYAIGRDSSSQEKVSIDSITTTVEPGQTVKFEIRIIPNGDLSAKNAANANLADTFKFNVSVEGKLDGNDTDSSELKSAKVTVTEGATTNIVASSNSKNFIALPGTSTQVASFNYNVKGDSKDVKTIVIELSGDDTLNDDMLDDVTIDFDWIRPALNYAVSWKKLTLTFNNVESLPVKNYNVKLYMTFNSSAVVKGTAGTPTAQVAHALSWIKIEDSANTSLWITYYVAKAHPILSVKEKNTNSGNERLDLNIAANTSDYTVTVQAITGTTNGAGDLEFKRTSWSTQAIAGMILSTTNEAIRSTQKWAAVKWISFDVTDDEGYIASYANVNADSIADFASLSL